MLLAGQMVNFDTHIQICLELELLVLEKVSSYAAAISASKYHGISGDICDIQPLHRFWLHPSPARATCCWGA